MTRPTSHDNIVSLKSLRKGSKVECCYTYRKKPNEEKAKLMYGKYPAIENIPNMQVPKTDTEVWECMDKGSQIADNAVQRSQNMNVAALAAVLSVINKIGSGVAGSAETHLHTLTDCSRMIISSFANLNQVRKEIVRNNLQYPIAKFCGADVPVGTDTLFVDLGKRLSERDTTKSKLVRRNYNNNYNGYNKFNNNK